MSTMLAPLSGNLMFSAIAVYLLAMLSYAVEAALRARTRGTSPMPAVVSIGAHTTAVPVGPEQVRSRHDESAPGRRIGRVGVSLTVLAFAVHAASVAARGLAAGRAPWGNMYEFATAGALAAAGAYLVFLRRKPVRDLGVWITALVTLALGLSVTVLYTPVGDLVPALNSYWLVVHVAAAIISGGVFTVGAAATALYLVRLRAERGVESDRETPNGVQSSREGYIGRLPAAAVLEKVAHSAHVFAFPIWTFAVIAGAIWAEESWGRYWGWDPKETWAFLTWVFYAAYFHAESTPGWRGRKAAWFAVAGYLAFLFNFVGVNLWITGLHSYAGV